MYGYVIVNKPELKFKEYDRYRSYYCGLCDILREQYGIRGQVSLSYDMTFLVILLTGLYEPQTAYLEERCIVHPVAKHPVRKNEVTSYVADMNVLMAYYKCVDDWKDEKKVTRLTYSRLLKGQVKKICGKYPQKAEAIRQALSGLSAAEKAGEEEYEDFDFFLYTKLTDARDLMIRLLQERREPVSLRIAMVLSWYIGCW